MPITNELTLEPLPPEEAIAYFKGKVLLTSKEYYALLDTVKTTAFTVSRVTKMDILSDIFDAVQAAIADGETLDDFVSRLDKVMAIKGWNGLTPWHAENVFRTNIQTAYSVGREEQYAGMEKAFPYAQYEAVNDDRVRDEHAALDGKIYPVNDSFWDMWTPPNGYNCRCAKRRIHKYEMRDRGFNVSDPIPDNIRPDKGFDVNPAKHQWKPKSKDYPPELWKQYKNEENKRSKK